MHRGKEPLKFDFYIRDYLSPFNSNILRRCFMKTLLIRLGSQSSLLTRLGSQVIGSISTSKLLKRYNRLQSIPVRLANILRRCFMKTLLVRLGSQVIGSIPTSKLLKRYNRLQSIPVRLANILRRCFMKTLLVRLSSQSSLLMRLGSQVIGSIPTSKLLNKYNARP
jgi:hypothetical protein